jgi:hypothetical protein
MRGCRIAQRLLAKIVAISIPFLWSACVLFTFIISQRSCGKFLKSLAVLLFLLFPAIPLLAGLKLVQQSLEEEWKKKCHVYANSCWSVLPPRLLAEGSIWAFPSGCPIPFFLTVPSGCPTAFKNISSGYGLKRGNFHLFSLKGHLSVTFIKSRRSILNVKNTSGSSPRTDLSNNITFSRSQSHATVSLLSDARILIRTIKRIIWRDQV